MADPKFANLPGIVSIVPLCGVYIYINMYSVAVKNFFSPLHLLNNINFRLTINRIYMKLPMSLKKIRPISSRNLKMNVSKDYIFHHKIHTINLRGNI